VANVRRFAFLLLLISALASAQTTWRGLRFGTDEAEVRKVYQGTLQNDQELLTKYGRIVLTDRDQKLADQRATAHLYFNKSGGLDEVELMLQEPFATEPANSAIPKSFAFITILDQELAEKYGKPTTREGECGLTIGDVVENRPQKIFLCNKMWKSEGQTISLHWSVQNQRLLSYFLNYKPLPKEI
jgi:hypothetical protein